jgi:undecaprenyl-phosphate galactose phosphotransferase
MNLKKIMERSFDIIFSVVALLITSPFILIIGILIKATDGGDIFFTQERVGKSGKLFKIIKFRSMYMDADKKLEEILKKNFKAKEEWEKFHKLKDDPRVTPIGKFIRRTSLDELPQFINVLKGEMSIVGPRPVTKEEIEKFYKEKANLILSVKPGITGYWQVEERNDIDNYERRVKMDEWYVKNKNFLFDLKIILKTIKVIFTGKGAY